MHITKNEDTNIVDEIMKELKSNGGYCPCVTTRTDNDKCICKDFKDKIKDESFEGYCHCTLYYKHLN